MIRGIVNDMLIRARIDGNVVTQLTRNLREGPWNARTVLRPASREEAAGRMAQRVQREPIQTQPNLR